MRVTGISYSSDRKLARCEMSYSYRYDQKLKPRVKSEGLFRGAWIHDLLEAHYLKTGWKKVFDSLKKKEWDKLFDEEKERFGLDFPQRIYDLMEHYVEHYSDNWEILHVEKQFSLNVRSLNVPLRWIMDLIVKEGKETLLIETKSKKKIPESDERILAPQVHAYCYLSSRIGLNIDRIVWNYIRTEPVPRPKILKNGSLSERKIQTDQRSYLAAMKEAGIHPKGEEIIGVNNFLETLPETLSLARVSNTPNLAVGELFVRDWVERARRAKQITNPTRHWDRSCGWMCDYYSLCQIDILGKSREPEIKKNFVRIGDIK